MPNWIPIVAAALAAIPAAAAFFVAYGRYDGMFQDRVVFLYFIGGMILGFFVSVLALLMLSGTFTGPLGAILVLSLLFPIAVVLMVNRRKWQGERHAVFNGGAAGLGFSVMMGFSMLFYRSQGPYNRDLQPLTEAWRASDEATRGSAPTLDTVPYAFDPVLLGQGLLLAVALTGLFFGLGLLAGNGVRLRKQFRMAFLGTAIIFPAMVFLEELFSPETTGKWTWAMLLGAYGIVFGVVAERRLLVEGIDVEARKRRRRLRRKAAQQP